MVPTRALTHPGAYPSFGPSWCLPEPTRSMHAHATARRHAHVADRRGAPPDSLRALAAAAASDRVGQRCAASLVSRHATSISAIYHPPRVCPHVRGHMCVLVQMCACMRAYVHLCACVRVRGCVSVCVPPQPLCQRLLPLPVVSTHMHKSIHTCTILQSSAPLCEMHQSCIECNAIPD